SEMRVSSSLMGAKMPPRPRGGPPGPPPPPRDPPPPPPPAREEPATPEPTPEPEQPQATPPPTAAPEQAEPDPTASPPTVPGAATGGNDGGRGLSNVALGAIAGGAILALLAIFALLLSMMLGNRGPQPEAVAVDAPETPEPSGPLASSSPPPTFDAGSRTEEPPAPESEPEDEPDREPEDEPEPEFDEWGPPPT
ncbi:MAG: hypothetical protein OXE43_13445, partial [Chloroflexi bacterium]|nr:hypothetical protein [Chloroflexota bacterium]